MSVPTKVYKTNSNDKWRCEKCSFDNLELIQNCEMCDHPRQKAPKKLEKESQSKVESEPKIECPNKKCKFLNPLTLDICQKCSQSLFGDFNEKGEDVYKQEKKKTLEVCRSCSFQNDPDNQICVNCQHKLITKRILRKPIKAPKPKKYYRGGISPTEPCPDCGTELRVIDYTTRETDICMVCEDQYPTATLKSLCIFCDSKISPAQTDSHDKTCEKRLQFFKKADNKTYERCTPLQYQTMIYMHKKCEKLHYLRQKALITRIKKLGYSEKDLQNLHHYIMHYAPIIIHMHVNTHFHFFLGDTHYRNQFETSKSSGALSHSARVGWEDRMFDKKHHSATGFERVKYGTMNFVNDPKGVRACMGYGQSYFLLKPHVRDRCTITDMDSSSPSSTLGTFRFIFHLLMKLSDAELNSAFEGSKGKQMQSHVIGSYKQIQIHGPVQFSKDIERVYISKAQLKLGDAKALIEQVKSFCSKNQVEYELFQTNTAAHSIFGAPPAALDLAVPERVIPDEKDLTEQELKPKPVPVPAAARAPAFSFGASSGVGFGGFAFGGASIFGAHSYPSFGAIAPSPFVAPKAPPKKKEYGVDYI